MCEVQKSFLLTRYFNLKKSTLLHYILCTWGHRDRSGGTPSRSPLIASGGDGSHEHVLEGGADGSSIAGDLTPMRGRAPVEACSWKLKLFFKTNIFLCKIQGCGWTNSCWGLVNREQIQGSPDWGIGILIQS